MLGTLLGATAILLPTAYLGYLYLPRDSADKNENNPGITSGSVLGILLLTVYLVALLSTSGFDFFQMHRRATYVYLLPALAFALIIFPRYATRASQHYLTYVEFGMFSLWRALGYVMLLFAVAFIASQAHG
jgi:hypothetical protein